MRRPLPFVSLLLFLFLARGVGAKERNLLLITVDTLRADFLGCYGYSQDISPNIDALAQDGVLFADALSVIGKTGPSFASLFSSLYPPSHGARRNGVRMRQDVPVLPQLLTERGYTTGAFVTNWTLKDRLSGVARGFHHFDEEFNLQRNSFGAEERDAKSVTKAALSWLVEQDLSRSVLLWVHYSEPHNPFELQGAYAPQQPPKEERRNGWLKRWKYASEIAFTDEWIGRLLKGVAGHLETQNTIVVFLSDHGESFGEHGYWGHGKNTHWPNLRIPWVIKGPGLPPGRRVETPASIVDVVPTILDLLGHAPLEGASGRSLASAWSGAAQDVDPLRYSIGERATALTKKGRSTYNHPLAISAQTPSVKAIYNFSRRELRYYDLRTDILELDPLEQSPVELRPPLGRLLSDWYKNLPKFEQRHGELSPEDTKQLRSLGYLGGN